MKQQRQPLGACRPAHLLLLAICVCGEQNCSGFSQPRFLQHLPGGSLPHSSSGSDEGILPHSGLDGAPQTTVSVVLMNWQRPDNVRLIVSALENYTSVGEVRRPCLCLDLCSPPPSQQAVLSEAVHGHVS